MIVTCIAACRFKEWKRCMRTARTPFQSSAVASLGERAHRVCERMLGKRFSFLLVREGGAAVKGSKCPNESATHLDVLKIAVPLFFHVSMFLPARDRSVWVTSEPLMNCSKKLRNRFGNLHGNILGTVREATRGRHNRPCKASTTHSLA